MLCKCYKGKNEIKTKSKEISFSIVPDVVVEESFFFSLFHEHIFGPTGSIHLFIRLFLQIGSLVFSDFCMKLADCRC